MPELQEKPLTTEIDSQDALQLVRTMTQHINLVQEGMLAVRQDLERRGLVHDRSKFSLDEFAAFTRINRAAREHLYGSPEYRAGLKAEAETVALHYKRNSHHPEHHEVPQWAEPHMWKAEQMGFLDIIEMVCDWRSAYLTYGSQGTWGENMDRQRERYRDWFSEGQWWLIGQVADFVAGAVK
jgi:hypothetical protein